MGASADAEEEDEDEAEDDCARCGHAAAEHPGVGLATRVCEVMVGTQWCPCEGYLSMTETRE
jgi:hypothetical protein